MDSSSRIELSRSALHKNIRYLKKQLPPTTVFTSVIKGNAYGHDIRTFVPLAESCGVRNYAVFSAEEAFEAFKASTHHSDIMIMGFLDPATLEWAIENEIAFWVHDLSRLEAVQNVARRISKPARIHIEIETGLNRTGLELNELDSLAATLLANPDMLLVEGVCTHFAGAESSANHLRIQKQIERFGAATDRLSQSGLGIQSCHTACSAAALLYPETILDRVRVGIAQYGFWPSVETKIRHMERTKRRTDPLVQVLNWKSSVMAVKEVASGDFVGYGNSHIATRRSRIAVVPVGYAEGFPRSLSNVGRVLIRARRAPVVGTVNMNMFCVDVSHIPGVQPGDEVVLIGRQGRAKLSISSFAELSNDLNYEALARLPSHIPRAIIK